MQGKIKNKQKRKEKGNKLLIFLKQDREKCDHKIDILVF